MYVYMYVQLSKVPRLLTALNAHWTEQVIQILHSNESNKSHSAVTPRFVSKHFIRQHMNKTKKSLEYIRRRGERGKGDGGTFQ